MTKEESLVGWIDVRELRTTIRDAVDQAVGRAKKEIVAEVSEAMGRLDIRRNGGYPL